MRCAASPGARHSSASSIPMRPGTPGPERHRRSRRPPDPASAASTAPCGSARGRLQLNPESPNPLEGTPHARTSRRPDRRRLSHRVCADSVPRAGLRQPGGRRGDRRRSPRQCACCCPRSACSPTAARPACPALQPRVAELRRGTRASRTGSSSELTALYRAEGGGMLAGCLPLLLQLPFFSVMYRLFLSKTVAGHAERAAGQGPADDAARQSLADRGRPRQHPRPGIPRAVRGAGRRRLPDRAGRQVPVWRTGSQRGRGARSAGQHGRPAGWLGALGRVLPYTTLIIAAFVPLAAVLYLRHDDELDGGRARASCAGWHRARGVRWPAPDRPRRPPA